MEGATRSWRRRATGGRRRPREGEEERETKGQTLTMRKRATATMDCEESKRWKKEGNGGEESARERHVDRKSGRRRNTDGHRRKHEKTQTPCYSTCIGKSTIYTAGETLRCCSIGSFASFQRFLTRYGISPTDPIDRSFKNSTFP